MKKNRMLTMQSKVRTLSIKCYDEQLPDGWTGVCEAIERMDKEVIQVQGIRHDMDYNSDSIWEPSTEKCHYHIILRLLNKKSMYVKNLLEMLHVKYREKEDGELWKHGGVETVWNYTSYSMYLTHETEEAIADGKAPYSIESVVSNMTLEEIKEIRDGYIQIGHNGGYKKTYKEMAELDISARKLGYDLMDFNSWYSSLDFGIRCNAKMKTVRESYYYGVKNRVSKDGHVVRVCIFIEGLPNNGKTYAAQEALSGKTILKINGGGSGKFDNLLPSHDAIVIDDHVCPNLLNMTDNYMCQVYKRQANNPFWCGQYLIVTSNLTFEEWLKECNINIESGHVEALRSRFFVCKVEEYNGINRLVCYSQSNRGSESEQKERNELFSNFRIRFNEIISKYRPKSFLVEDVIDFVPADEITPFEILEEKIEKSEYGQMRVYSDHECLCRYLKEKPKIYEKASKEAIKKFKDLGILNVQELPKKIYEQAVLHICAKIDLKEQLGGH